LSLCCGIVKEHGGTITATSKPGEGASFTIEEFRSVVNRGAHED
jgi:signal transduction histidine kinase